MIRRAAIALTPLLAIAACAHGGGAAPSAPADGATLYRRTCAACHRLKDPSEKDAATWRRAVDRFGKHLSPAERELVYEYLAAHAKPAP